MIEFTGGIGLHISTVISDMIALAKSEDELVWTNFNGVPIVVNGESNAEEVFQLWESEANRRREEYSRGQKMKPYLLFEHESETWRTDALDRIEKQILWRNLCQILKKLTRRLN